MLLQWCCSPQMHFLSSLVWITCVIWPHVRTATHGTYVRSWSISLDCIGSAHERRREWQYRTVGRGAPIQGGKTDSRARKSPCPCVSRDSLRKQVKEGGTHLRIEKESDRPPDIRSQKHLIRFYLDIAGKRLKGKITTLFMPI